MSKNVEMKLFIPCLVLLVAMLACVFFLPEQTYNVITATTTWICDKLGWFFMALALVGFGFCFWLMFGKYGNVRLGEPDEKPQFADVPWIAMLFTAGVGSSIVVLGFFEPISYLTSTPFDIEPFSKQAYEYAHMYGQFHWGLSAWALYVPATVGIAYVIFNRRKASLRLSEVLEPILKHCKTHLVHHIIDILVIFGLGGAIVTSLGIATPVVAELFMYVFNIPADYYNIVMVCVVIVWVCIFGTSVFKGLDKGIKNLSNFNLILAGLFMLAVLLLGPTIQIFKMEVNSVGLFVTDFFRMSTQADPFGDGAFARDWTSFYWAFFLAYMPMMGLFVGRISRGRTIRNVVWGEIIWGFLGCALTFLILGGYALWIQDTGKADLVTVLADQGQGAAIVLIMQTFPFKRFFMIVLALLLFIYLATTIDSSAYVLAGVTSKRVSAEEDPTRGNRLFWAIAFSAFAIGIMLIGGLNVIKSMSIISGPVLGIINILMMFSLKMIFDADIGDKGLKALKARAEAAKAVEEAEAEANS